MTPPRLGQVQNRTDTSGSASLCDQLHALDWFQFETLVEILYRKLGFQVERRGGARPDGGLDLLLGQGSSATGIQCKHWPDREVGVRHVRELLGALQDAGIKHGKIIAIGGFTGEARLLASRHNIELVGQQEFLNLLGKSDAAYDPAFRTALDPASKSCPRCEKPMRLRTSRQNGESFWGCSSYPRCHGTIPA